MEHDLLLAVSKHQTIQAFEAGKPSLGQGGFVAPSASLIGNISLGKGSSVWYNAVLRGELLVVKSTRPAGHKPLCGSRRLKVVWRAFEGVSPEYQFLISSNHLTSHALFLIISRPPKIENAFL
jgi:hypothetical protein